jgi:hypothetical protein
VQGTNKHATMFPSSQLTKLVSKHIQNYVYFACMAGVPRAEVGEPVSNGAKSFHQVVNSAHIYGVSVRNCSGSGGPGIVRRVSSYLFSYLIYGFLGVSLKIGPKISHTILRLLNIVPTATEFIFFC